VENFVNSPSKLESSGVDLLTGQPAAVEMVVVDQAGGASTLSAVVLPSLAAAVAVAVTPAHTVEGRDQSGCKEEKSEVVDSAKKDQTDMRDAHFALLKLKDEELVQVRRGDKYC
jgi:hypothetical protein